MKPRPLSVSGLLIVPAFSRVNMTMRSQLPAGDRVERYRKMSVDAETQGLAEPFKGMTTTAARSGHSPRSVPLASPRSPSARPPTPSPSLSAEQRTKTMFAVDDPEWRKWMNQHFYIRQG